MIVTYPYVYRRSKHKTSGNYLLQGGIIIITIFSVCLFVGLCKYYWLDLPEKKSKDGCYCYLGPIKF